MNDTELYVLQKIAFYFSLSILFQVIICIPSPNVEFKKAIVLVSAMWFLMLGAGKLHLLGVF